MGERAREGVLHSEFNPSSTETSHLLQIWIEPNVRGVRPSYEQTFFPAEEKRGKLRLVASGDGREGSVTIHQDAALYAALLAPGETVRHALAPGRRAYLHVARGVAVLNSQLLQGGDGAKVAPDHCVPRRARVMPRSTAAAPHHCRAASASPNSSQAKPAAATGCSSRLTEEKLADRCATA